MAYVSRKQVVMSNQISIIDSLFQEAFCLIAGNYKIPKKENCSWIVHAQFNCVSQPPSFASIYALPSVI